MEKNASRLDNSLRNIKYTALAQAVNFLIVFISRRVFVLVLSSEYLGLNGVFSNILSMLSLAELGLGSAICFCLYKPIFEKDHKTINSIMLFYKKAYTLIGTVIFVIGAALTPFLNFIVEELPDIRYIRLIYILFVLNSASSYFFVYKKTLLIADQKQYISNVIHQAFVFLMNVLQIVFLLLTHNYFSYLIIMIASTVGQNIFVSALVSKKYPYLDMKHAEPLDKETRKEVFKNIRAMTSHRIGGVVVNGTDNIIMAKCVSVVSVGLYSNYYLIKNTLISVFALFFQSITSSIGNLGAETEDGVRKEQVFNILNFVSAWVIGFSSICLFVLYNPFIELWVGREYLFDMKIVAMIVVNFYMYGMRQSVLTTRDALGIFWYDRHKPIFEAVINLVFSIPLAMVMGISGVLLGTLISTVTTSLWVEPYVLYKHGFQKNCVGYFGKYFLYTAVTVGAGAACWYLCSLLTISNMLLLFVAKALICGIISNIVFLLVYFKTKPFQAFVNILKRKFLRGK